MRLSLFACTIMTFMPTTYTNTQIHFFPPQNPMPEFMTVDGVIKFLIAISDHDDPFEMLAPLQGDSGLKAIK